MYYCMFCYFFFFSSRRRHTRFDCDWSSDVCSSDLESGLAIVAAARAGVVALMKSLAREFGRSGTTCNTVSLGLVETDHDKDWVEANREKLVKLYPVRRLGQPADIVPMVTLLASPSSGWITGQVLSISGGYSMV